VRTVRDSLLLRLLAAAFGTLGDRHPQVVLQLHRALARHLLVSSASPPAPGPLCTVAVVPAGARPIPPEFGAELAGALGSFGATRHVTAAVVDDVDAGTELFGDGPARQEHSRGAVPRTARVRHIRADLRRFFAHLVASGASRCAKFGRRPDRTGMPDMRTPSRDGRAEWGGSCLGRGLATTTLARGHGELYVVGVGRM